MFSVQYTMALLELQGYFLHCNVHHIYHISRRCWSSTLSRTHSRGSRRNFKRAAAPILLLELMISILTGWYTSLCVSASHHVSSVFFVDPTFFYKNSTECLTFTFVLIFCAEQSFFVSICCPSPSECMQVFSFCKRLGATRETVCLQIATFCTNIQHQQLQLQHHDG